MLIFLSLITIFLITNNQLVISGASYGLMLWYENVLPLLLPFMLISGLLENYIINHQSSKKSGRTLAITSVVFLGLFCGYPIGAKSNAFFVSGNMLPKRLGNILLPLCNNISPMFLLGFVLAKTLNNTVSVIDCYIVLFTPYLIILFIEILLSRKKALLNIDLNKSLPSRNTKRSITEQSIDQITHVGLYIMLCSILTEFILSVDCIPEITRPFITGIIEITRGVSYIGASELLDIKIKTALILACTSFGGISSILQTYKVIQGSGLSLFHYITVKVLCSLGTYMMCILII